MPGLNSSIGTKLQKINKGFFKNLEISNRPIIGEDYAALVGDLTRYSFIDSPSFTGNVTIQNKLYLKQN